MPIQSKGDRMAAGTALVAHLPDQALAGPLGSLDAYLERVSRIPVLSREEIHEYVLRNWRLVKIATTKAQRKLFFNLRRLKKNLGWLSAQETAAVARDLGVSEAEVSEMEKRLAARDLSFDPAPEPEDEEPYGPAAYLPAPDADPAAQVEEAESAESSSDRLRGALSRLDARSRDIVEKRWMSEDKATLHQLAAQYGVSAERIRQIESSALGKLRALVAA